MERNYKKNQQFYFLQIGAFDGISFDFLYLFVKKLNAFGTVVEPVHEYYEQLVSNYSYNPNIVPVNLAVHSTNSEIVLHKAKSELLPTLPDWTAGITSVNPLHHIKLNIPTSAMTEIKVSAMPVMDLIKEYFPYEKMNFLQIDVEGYDYEILKSFDFSVITPDMIKLEYVALNAEDVNAAIKLLQKNKYYCFYDHSDLIGVRLSRVRL